MKVPLSWRVRMSIEFVLFAIMVVCLIAEDAPRWAIILGIYIGTRTSMLETANELGALQSSVRIYREDLRREIQAEGRCVRDEIRRTHAP